ncbi:MAG: late competence development ComFB family protein [Cyanobacteria bacterium P01_A01_bin.105]
MRSDIFARTKVAYSSFAFNQKKKKPRPTTLSDNLTEKLVQTEIECQFATLPERVVRVVTSKRADVMAYALNRLPALYASTNRGRQKQESAVSDKFYAEVQMVVRQAIAAVSNDPLRTQSDSWQSVEAQECESALTKLKDLLKFDCGWQNVSAVVSYRLIQAARGEFYVDPKELRDWEQNPLHQQ